MKSILEALQTKKVIYQGFSELSGYMCGVCGGKYRWNETGEHREMTGHDDFRPIFKNVAK